MYAKHAKVRSRFVVTADRVKPGAWPNLQALPLLLALLLFALTTFGCGGAYSKPAPTSDPLVQVRVTGGSQLIANVGGTVPLNAQGMYQSPAGVDTYKDVTSSAAWSTSNAAVATVDKGVVTGTGIGNASISATFGGVTGSITIVVGLTGAGTITISPAGPFSLAASTSVTFHATELLSDGTTLDVSGPAFWDSSHGDIVSIYPFLGGDATLVAPGTTTVTATLTTGEVGSLDVTVIP